MDSNSAIEIGNSARLGYRLITESDKQQLFELDQDPEVMRFINGGKATSMEDVEKIYIPRVLAYRNPVEGWGLWHVSLLDNGEFIGWILIRPMNFFSEAPEPENLEIGWRFKRKFWGKGYATEAAITVRDALVKRGRITQLTALAMADNSSSINIMKKLGMTYAETTVQCDPLGDFEAVFYTLNLT